MTTRKEIETMSINELASFIGENLQDKVPNTTLVSEAFRENNISGKLFLELSTEDLKDLIPLIGDRKEVKRLIDTYSLPVLVSLMLNSEY